MLNGQNVLIVEAEFLIALDIQRMLETLAAGQMLFARSLPEALDHQHHWHTVDLAIVELADDSDQNRTLLSQLRDAGITVILSTTDSKLHQGHPEFPDAPVIVKPMVEDDFSRAVRAALLKSARTNGYDS